MSDNNKVLWSEGLFLRTQHFQQQDRYVESLVRGAMKASSLQNWGFAELKLDQTALDAGQVAVEKAAGIFPDGTPFSIPDTMAAPDALPLSADTPSGFVELALPLETPGGTVFDPAHADPTGARYRGRIEKVRDTIHRGADPEEIEVALPVPRLIAPGGDAGGYTTLIVADVDGLRADGSVAMRENFLPPALITQSVSTYAGYLREIATGLDRIADAHGEMVIGGAGRSVENLMILELANSSRPRIAHMLEQDLFHPAELYLELSGLAGRMATYGSGSRRLTELPPYDHRAPTPAFAELMDTIRSLILSLRYVEPKSHALQVAKHTTNVWKVRIDSPETLTNSKIVLRVGSELSDEALRKIFVNQVTVGAADEFEDLWKARLPGIPLKPLHSHPREIPYDGDRLCLELDQKSEHWASLLDSPGFVVGVSGSLPSEPKIDCYAVHR